jgi:hypothetical protein
VSGFSSEWLALREPLDMRARNKDLLAAVAAAFRGRKTLSIVDLGSGTGSTVRALSAHLPTPQGWRLVDNDPILLAEAYAMERPADVMVETVQFDLADDVAPLFDGADLVTSSALMDLVSEPWLANLAAAAAARSLPVYIALTYDGRAAFSTVDPLDALIISRVNTHQLGNKGFGPALGPRAVASAQKIFRALGYSLNQGTSDWIAGTADVRFQVELLTGWLQAAREIGDLAPDTLEDWFRRRCDAVEAGKLTLTVGHVDFFAQPLKR